MNWKALFILLTLLSSLASALCQDSQAYTPLHYSYEIEDGLNSNFVVFLYNDSRGLLWVGTEQGLSVYNGRDFRPIDFGVVEDPFVALIAEDPDGVIWFATLGGGLYSVENETAVPHPMSESIDSFFENFWVPDKLAFNAEGNILLGNPRQILEVKPDSVTELYHQTSKHPTFFTIGNEFLGVSRMSELPDSFIEVNFQGQDFSFPDTGENIAHNRFFYANSERSFAIANSERIAIYQNGVFKDLKLGAPTSNSICIENDSTCWIGTEGAGAFKIVNGKIIANIFPRESVYTICFDFEGGMWIGTGKSGLNYVPNADARIIENEGHIKLKAHALDVYNDELVALTQDFSIYKNGQVSMPFLDAKDVLHTRYEIYQPKDSNYFVWDDHQSMRYISCIDWGSATIKSKGIALTPRKILIHKSDTIIGGQSSLLIYYNDNSKEEVNTQIRKLSQIAPAQKKDHFWILSLDGVCLLHLDSELNKAEVKQRFTPVKNALFLLQFQQTMLVVSRDGNFYEMDTLRNELIKVTGIEKHRAKSFAKVSDSQFLVGTENGLLMISEATDGKLSFRHLHSEAGLPDLLIKDIAISSKHIYCLSESEVFSLPKSILSATFPNKGRLNFSKAWVKHKDGSKSNTLALKTDESIRAHLTAVSFKDRRQYKVQFRLLPVQTNWSEALSTDFYFYNLPSDDYILEVRDAYGNHDELSFIVESYFYDRGWFLVLVILIVAVMLASPFYLQYRFRTARALLETEKNDLRLKALTSQLKPHFVFNALSSIQSYILRQDVRASSDYLAKFAMHIRHALVHSNQDDISLTSALDSIKNYLDLERMRLQGSFDYSIETDPKLNTDALHIPVMLVQPYIENAVIHGMASIDDGGWIHIRWNMAGDNTIRCEITDNGKGLPGSGPAAHRPAGNGMGTRINKERMQLLNALNKNRYKVDIRPNDTEPGVTVTIEITFDHETYQSMHR